MRRGAAPVALLLLLLASFPPSQACVHLFGESPNSLLEIENDPNHFTWAFSGDDWGGTCATGRLQSPMSLYTSGGHYEPGPFNLRTTWSYTPLRSNGSNVYVYNNGHTIQVEWATGAFTSNVEIRTLGQHITDSVTMDPNTPATDIKTVRARPVQMHFHIDSSHALDGMNAPLEMHIVHTTYDLPRCTMESPCNHVTGVLFQLDEEDRDNAALQTIWDNMPWREGSKVNLTAGTEINVEALLPQDRTYVAYQGSLTTPPCTEGLLWHVFVARVPLSRRQLQMFHAAVSFKECSSTEQLGLPDFLRPIVGQNVRFRQLRGDHTQPGGHSHGAGAKATGHTAPSAMAQAVAGATPFLRGSVRGFVEVQPQAVTYHPQRRLLQQTGDPNISCTIGAYGWNSRTVQPRNGRPMRIFFTSQSATLTTDQLSALKDELVARLEKQTLVCPSLNTDGLATSDQVYGVGLGVGLGMGLITLVLLLALMARVYSKPAPATSAMYLEPPAKP